jgi:hypothetical protein
MQRVPLRRGYQRLRAAAVVVQSRRRGKVLRDKHVAVVETFKVLQARVRGRQVRKKAAFVAAAATRLQAAWRGHRQRGAFAELRNGARLLAVCLDTIPLPGVRLL